MGSALGLGGFSGFGGSVVGLGGLSGFGGPAVGLGSAVGLPSGSTLPAEVSCWLSSGQLCVAQL